jgi:hypothetical protein
LLAYVGKTDTGSYPKIAAGPVTLAITDFVALAFYFGIASLVL